MRTLPLVVSFVAALGCNPPSPAASTSPHAPQPVPPPPAADRGVRFVAAPADGDVASIVSRVRAEADAHHRRLIVYVGATWCEPCQYFHHAAEAHALDEAFPDLTLLEFDLDRDQHRLEAANYVARMIPLFALPGADGRAAGPHIEGSIHGPGSVGEITPRLRVLLGA